jgi:ubiquitin-conjugating enzyme E2 variant
MWLLEAVGVILLVDFASGLIHWVEDTFWTEDTPLVGRWIVVPNVLHHHDGSAFVRNNWLQSSWDLLTVGALIVGFSYLTNLLSWQVWLFVAIGVNANQIHKWSHVPPGKVPSWVRALQSLYVLQSSAHHVAHHRNQKNSAYCVITPVLNPVLKKMRFWRALDQILVRPSAAPRRADLAASAVTVSAESFLSR